MRTPSGVTVCCKTEAPSEHVASGADALATVTGAVTVEETLPERSTAWAARVWLPLVSADVSQDHDQLAVPVAWLHPPPSTEMRTLATPTLSVALPVTLTVPDTVTPGCGEAMETFGAVASP